MGSHFFSRANIQQCPMHKYSRMYSQNQICTKWLVRDSNKMRIINLNFGKMQNFSVIQKEKYFKVCICYEKNCYGQFSEVSNDNLWYFTSCSWWIWKKLGKGFLRNSYPAHFRGCRFFDKRSKEKNHYAAGQSGERFKPSPVGFSGEAPENCGYFAFWIAQNITLMALGQRTVTICLFLDELIFILLRVWWSEFGIPNHYISFRIALDTPVLPNWHFDKS